MSGKDMIAALDEAVRNAVRPSIASGIQRLRDEIAAEIEQFADDDSDVSDAYRHAALIAKGTQPA